MTADTTLPEQVIEDAERLTRLARRTDDEERALTYRREREELLAEHGFEARVREDDDPVLVCYPAEWIQDGEVAFDRIEDRSRAVERSLVVGGEGWETVEAANRAVVEQVADEYGPDHAANVRAFADFLGNHHTCRIADATETHVQEFLTEYYPRNVWPTDEQRNRIKQSLRLAFETAGGQAPPVE